MTTCIINNMTIAKGAAQKKNINLFDIVIVSNSRLSGATYRANEYVFIGTDVYICILANTAGSTNEPGTGASWETYWTLVDDSIVTNKITYFEVKSQRDVTGNVFYFKVNDGATDVITITITPGGEADDVPTAGILNFWISETDSDIDVGTYNWELSFVDSSQAVGQQKYVQCSKGSFIVCENYNE